MIDFANIEKYKENNRIEAKKAVGGFPHSIWETYSAFANTLGGIILLGVEEYADKSFHLALLPDPEMLIEEFWRGVKDKNKVSANILTEKDVTVEDIDGRRIVAIRIPRARRTDKPVYINGDPFLGSYRRSGEGDYRCSEEEVRTMMRDAVYKTQDMLVLENAELSSLDYSSVKRYRRHIINEDLSKKLDELEFLCTLGALGKASDGAVRPTAAGLLMFGHEHEIVKVFPEYLLDYREISDTGGKISFRIVSSSANWSGNVCDFYFDVYDRITQNFGVLSEHEAALVNNALKQALANCLINADYHGKDGVMITKADERITMSNPGSFRIDVEAAKTGGVSDPRNSALIKMFNAIDVSEGAGGGIPYIFNAFRKLGRSAPIISESFEPDRISLILPMGKSGGKKIASKSIAHKQVVISYLTENVVATSSDIAELIGIKPVRAKELLDEMARDGIIIADDVSRTYKLKA